MIDSHCHLDHEPLLNNIYEVLNRSKDVGIKKLLTMKFGIFSGEVIRDFILKHFKKTNKIKLRKKRKKL